MLLELAQQFLINAHIVPATSNIVDLKQEPRFEFIFNQDLKLIELIQLIPSQLFKHKFEPIKDPTKLHRVLFELNHVRVNPKLNNHAIISMLTHTLDEAGIRINNQPSQNSLAICFKPLGEIVDRVRFYLKENNQIIFLSREKPKLTLVK